MKRSLKLMVVVLALLMSVSLFARPGRNYPAYVNGSYVKATHNVTAGDSVKTPYLQADTLGSTIGTTITPSITATGTITAEQLTSTDDATVTDNLNVGGDAVITGNLTAGSFSGGITLTGDLDMSGGSIVNSPTISNLASHGAGYWLDGVDDVFQLPQVANVQLQDSSGYTLLFKLKWAGGIPSSYVIPFGNNAITKSAIYFAGNGGLKTLAIDAQSGSGSQEVGSWVHDIFDGDEHSIVISVNDTNLVSAYVDGNVDISGTIPYSDVNFYTIGEGYNSGDYGWVGIINEVKLFNRVLSPTEVKNLYSNGNLDYADIGASNTPIYDSDFSANTDGWATSRASASVVGGYLKVVNTDLTLNGYVYQSFSTEIGKTYKFSSYYYADSSTVTDAVIKCGGTGLGTSDYLSLHVADVNVSETLVDTFVATTSTLNVVLYSDSHNDAEHWWKDISITQLGCVADYSSSGVGQYTWADNSGNQNHATNSGAIPINLEYNQPAIAFADDVSADKTMTDAIPERWFLEYILVENSTADADTLDFGTSAGGGQIADNQVIVGSDVTTIVVNKFYTLPQTVYITDENGNGWHSTHDITIQGRWSK